MQQLPPVSDDMRSFDVFSLGEIAILVPTFDLSYLGTNLRNYGTIIYPIMVIRAPLLQ